MKALGVFSTLSGWMAEPTALASGSGLKRSSRPGEASRRFSSKAPAYNALRRMRPQEQTEVPPPKPRSTNPFDDE